MPSPIEQAMRQICEEKGLTYESVLETINIALAAAYRKDFGEKNQNAEAIFDPETGNIEVFDVKTVVEDISDEELNRLHEEELQRREAIREVKEAGKEIPPELLENDDEERYNPKLHIMISAAKEIKPDADLGEEMRIPLAVPGAFGRMAAQTAKQVITQKLREAEREIVYSEFKGQEGEIVMGSIQRREGRVVLVDIGRTTAVLCSEDQSPTDRYNPGERMKFYLRTVELGTRGPEIVLSRSHEGFVQRLFETEIPEIGEGTVVIKSIAREAGARSKVAVSTSDDNIDPIGACIGQRGARIQTIIGEMGGEKIDIVEWSEDPKTFIINALSPASIVEVSIDEAEHGAMVKVKPEQLSLAIGKGGQNVRLAARLTGWKINISETEEAPKAEENTTDAPAPQPEAASESVPDAESVSETAE